MAFKSSLEVVNNVAKITLIGELDASTAATFRADIESAAGAKLKALVFFMKDLEYMASAGLRAIVFAKQKVGSQVEMYMIGVQETVMNTITQAGFQNSATFLDEYDAAKVEGV